MSRKMRRKFSETNRFWASCAPCARYTSDSGWPARSVMHSSRSLATAVAIWYASYINQDAATRESVEPKTKPFFQFSRVRDRVPTGQIGTGRRSDRIGQNQCKSLKIKGHQKIRRSG